MKIQTIKNDSKHLKTLINTENRKGINDFMSRFQSAYNFNLIKSLSAFERAKFEELI
jgi:hypothetical protein